MVDTSAMAAAMLGGGVAAMAAGCGGTAARAAASSAVIGAARRLLAQRDRAAALAPWGLATAAAAAAVPARPVTLQAAIERDFALFDVERAEAELRAALAALCGAPEAVAPATTAAPRPDEDLNPAAGAANP